MNKKLFCIFWGSVGALRYWAVINIKFQLGYRSTKLYEDSQMKNVYSVENNNSTTMITFYFLLIK